MRQLDLIRKLIFGHVIGGHRGLLHVLLFVLRALGAGLFLVRAVLLFAGGLGLFFLLVGFGGLIVFGIGRVGVVAQLVAVSQLFDHAPRQTGKAALIFQQIANILECALSLTLNEIAPQIQNRVCAFWQFTPGGQFAQVIAHGLCQRRVFTFGDAIIATAHCLIADFGIDVFGCAGHVPRPRRLTARGFQGVVNLKRHLTLWRVALKRRLVVKFVTQRQRIGGAARDQHFVFGHPPRHLRQAHGIARQTRGVHRIGDRQLRIVGEHFCGFGQRLFERIGRVIRGLVHALVKSCARRSGKRKTCDTGGICVCTGIAR